MAMHLPHRPTKISNSCSRKPLAVSWHMADTLFTYGSRYRPSSSLPNGFSPFEVYNKILNRGNGPKDMLEWKKARQTQVDEDHEVTVARAPIQRAKPNSDQNDENRWSWRRHHPWRLRGKQLWNSNHWFNQRKACSSRNPVIQQTTKSEELTGKTSKNESLQF